MIGRGGMGEVVAAHDQRIGREVAIKRMRGGAPIADAVARFLREARIQARLEHPAIVPVHELGIDDDGRPYFAMKRLAGTTLARAARAADGATASALLRAFVDVCLAIELAHTRGVVHRDLKPANIMLGDFGEVYVLDWGLARVLGDGRAPTRRAGDRLDAARRDGDRRAPRHARLHGARADARRARSARRPTSTRSARSCSRSSPASRCTRAARRALASTLARAPQASPAQRAARHARSRRSSTTLCVEALADDPATRPTARELAERVQRYLDGDRDLERRRELAAEQLASARAALARRTTRADRDARAGRALALDPDSRDAAELVTR